MKAFVKWGLIPFAAGSAIGWGTELAGIPVADWRFWAIAIFVSVSASVASERWFAR